MAKNRPKPKALAHPKCPKMAQNQAKSKAIAHAK